jgi:hypothetical protein
MKNTIILSVVISFVVGVGAGYFFGNTSRADISQSQETENAIAMMKNQSAAIQQMGQMMKTQGVMMQNMGMKYKDDEAVSKGKDLETVGEKYLQEMMSSGADGATNHMMGN